VSGPDPSVCPLCRKDNDCAMARGASGCWCERVSISAAVLDRVPEPLKGAVCVCLRCAEGGTEPSGSEVPR
jgi:hypothetical protein